MEASFYIPADKLGELKAFIRAHLPTARFKHNPLRTGGQWLIGLTLSVQDHNKLNTLRAAWHNEVPTATPRKASAWGCIKKCLAPLFRKTEK